MWRSLLLGILKIHAKLTNRVGSSLLASFLILGLPAYLVLGVLSYKTESHLLTYDAVLAIAWLSIAPHLISRGFDLVSFLDRRYGNSTSGNGDGEGLIRLLEQMLGIVQRRYFIFSLPLSLTAFCAFIRYQDAPLSARIGVALVSWVTLFLAGIGFWGMIVLFSAINRMKSIAFPYDYAHSDGLGGLQDLYRAINRAVFYFSTGALFIPMVIEIARSIKADALPMIKSEYILGLPTLLLVMIVGFILIGFAAPIFLFHDILGKHKAQQIAQLEQRLDAVTEFPKFPVADKEEYLLRLLYTYTYYQVVCQRAASTRTWPFDVKAIVVFLGSLVSPAVVLITQLLKGSSK